MRRRRRVAGAFLGVVLVAVSAVSIGQVFGLGADTDAASAAHQTVKHASGGNGSLSATTPTTGSETAAAHGNVYAGIGVGMFSPAVRGIPERVYVPNSESGSVSVIDPRTFRVIRTFATGVYDQHITPGWNLRWLYVNNTASNTLTVVDPRTARPVRTIPVTDPYNLYFTPDGSKAIVVAENYVRLDFYNPHTWRLIKHVAIPSAGPDHLDFTANGKALVISCEFTGRVYRVNTTTMRVTGSVDVGGLPVDVKLSPNGERFYVANQGTNGVTMIDARTLRIIGFLHTGRGAHGMAISRSTKQLYLANRIAGTISVISFARHHVVATWRVGGSPDMLQVSPDGTQLWASNRYNGTISVISTRSGRRIHTIRVGNSPHGLTYFPQPGAHSIGHNGVYR